MTVTTTPREIPIRRTVKRVGVYERRTSRGDGKTVIVGAPLNTSTLRTVPGKTE